MAENRPFLPNSPVKNYRAYELFLLLDEWIIFNLPGKVYGGNDGDTPGDRVDWGIVGDVVGP